MPYTTDGQVPYQSGSETSYQSAKKQARNPQRGAKVAVLMQHYRQAGSAGMTDAEMVRRTGFLLQSVCSLRGQLVQERVVKGAGKRMGDYGSPVQVWVWCGEGE